jgi:hypothetical protein
LADHYLLVLKYLATFRACGTALSGLTFKNGRKGTAAVCSLFRFRYSVGADMNECADKLRFSLETQHTPLADPSLRTKIRLQHPRADIPREAHVVHVNQLVSVLE